MPLCDQRSRAASRRDETFEHEVVHSNCLQKVQVATRSMAAAPRRRKVPLPASRREPLDDPKLGPPILDSKPGPSLRNRPTARSNPAPDVKSSAPEIVATETEIAPWHFGGGWHARTLNARARAYT